MIINSDNNGFIESNHTALSITPLSSAKCVVKFARTLRTTILLSLMHVLELNNIDMLGYAVETPLSSSLFFNHYTTQKFVMAC